MIEDDNQYSQVMTVVPIKEKYKFKHKEYKFSVEEAFPLKSTANDCLEILLLDENNKRIIITNSLPTVVQLSAKIIMNDEFHLRFTSTASKYKSNAPTSFKYLMNAPASVNEEYRVALINTTFKNTFLPDKNFKFYFRYKIYKHGGVALDKRELKFGEDCLNANEIYSKCISELDTFTYEGNTIIEAKENNDGVLSLIYKRHASFTFSYHLTRILGIREQFFKFSEILRDPNRNIEEIEPDDIERSINRVNNGNDFGSEGKKSKLRESFELKLYIYIYIPQMYMMMVNNGHSKNQ